VESRIVDVQEYASGGGVEGQGEDLGLEGACKDKGKDHEQVHSGIEEIWQVARNATYRPWISPALQS
jgi:hypothetical protein